jgi:hypothetical protein
MASYGVATQSQMALLQVAKTFDREGHRFEPGIAHHIKQLIQTVLWIGKMVKVPICALRRQRAAADQDP